MATVTVKIAGLEDKTFTNDYSKMARKAARKYIRNHDLSIKDAATITGEGTKAIVITFTAHEEPTTTTTE